jgi:hypothetical protein
MGNLHEDQYNIWSATHWIFIRVKNVTNKSYKEKWITFCPRAFSVSLTVFEIIKQKTANIQAATFGAHTNAYTNCQHILIKMI